MEVNEVQRVRSTLSHTPDRLQVLLIMVVVLGHWRVRVVPASVSGQKKNAVVSASHITVAASMCVIGMKYVGPRRDRKFKASSCNEMFECHFLTFALYFLVSS